ncbi:MAG TPA: tetratricopeptide repeat protein [Opitutales bacterium]|nr:tetratricopeptide repeat protein [Opitutales bacterium]
MSEILISDLNPRLQKQVENARFAIDRDNLEYAIEICMNVLVQEPGCLPVRKLLRAAQMKQFRSKNKFVAKAVGGISSALPLMAGGSKVKKDPAKALEAAEKALTKDPTNVGAHKLIAQAAKQLDFLNTVVFAWESIREQSPENVKVLLALGNAYIEAERGEDAVAIGDQLLKISPGLGEAQDLLKAGSVSQSLTKGRWEEEDASYRSKLRDADEAVSLEQAARLVTEEDVAERLLKEALQRVEEEPQNLNHYRDVIDNYEQLKDYPKAIEWLEKAREMPAGAADATLVKRHSDLKLKMLEIEISEHEAKLAEDPENEALQTELEQLKENLRTVRTEEAQNLVERYPNDPSYRFELGKLFYEAEEIDKAIQQFQVSQRSPKVRLQSLTFLGACFKSKQQYDLAIEQYQTAKAEISGMNDQKKEIIYQLAECYELMGKREEAISEYKLIYAADIGYRDVAAKIDEYYAKG